MKKLYSLLMVVLLAGLAAQGATNYGIKVAGVSVTSSNASNITGSNISGSVTYNNSTKTLTMTNVTINLTSGSDRALLNTGCDGLIVRFEGTCTLKTTNKAPVRTECKTYLFAPSGSVVNITGVNEGAIFMAGDNHQLNIYGPGKFYIKTTKCPAIEGAESTGQLPSAYYIEFYDVTAELYSPENALRRLYGVTFHESSHITFKATNNADYSIATSIQAFVFNGKEAVLAPIGAYASNSAGAFLDADGNRIKYQDVYVSDNYAFLINSTNFPNANFRNYMLGLYPKGYMTQNDVNNCTYLNVASKNISSLKGVELLTELKTLHCNSNSLTSLDLRSNTKLTYINCADNQLTSLYVQGLSNLESLYCGGNKLTSVSVNSFSSLKNLGCSNMTTLTSLYCNNCDLTNLNVTGCTALRELQCHYNNNLTTITGLDYCTAMTYLDCTACAITNLDVVNSMTNLNTLLASYNKLTSLSITGKSQLTDLRVGGNTLLTRLLCYRNALTSLVVTGCTAMTDLRCYENADLTSIYGLGNCTAITYLDCEDCAITNLDDLNNLTNLVTLYARNNKFTTLNVTGKSNLTYLYVSGNTQLTSLNCRDNALTTLDVTNCSAMTYLSCSHNQLTLLSVQGCTALKTLYCYQNKISGSGMNTLVNSLPTRSTTSPGDLHVIYSYAENNSITSAQVTTARNKNWLSKKWNGSTWVEIQTFIRGDVDGDGHIGIGDVTTLIDYLLNGDAAGVNLDAADVDADGNVGIGDVTELIDLILAN